MDFSRITDNITKQANGCWLWNKSTNSAGYGQLSENKKYWLAHRYALSCKKPVADSDIVRHLCHTPRCCNPEHLLVGTHADNYKDSLDKYISANLNKRKKWTVGDRSFATCKEMQKQTGLTYSSIIKYTNNGVFDVVSYREACKRARCTPKV